MNRDTLLGILRHFLTVAGGGLVANGTTTSSELEQGIGAILTLGGIAWSIWAKRQPARGSSSGNGAITLLSVLVPALVLLSGCATTGSGDQVITPARVEKITRLAVWTTTTGWTVRQPESTPKFRAALKGIDALVAEENWDVVALASALTSSGANAFTGPEGRLIVSGTTLLIDTFAGDKVDLSKPEYAKSVVLGAQAGLRLALGVSAHSSPPSNPAASAEASTDSIVIAYPVIFTPSPITLMPPLAEAIILAAKYGPVLVSKIIEVANKPPPTREEWAAVFAEAAHLDYNDEIKAAHKRVGE